MKNQFASFKRTKVQLASALILTLLIAIIGVGVPVLASTGSPSPIVDEGLLAMGLIYVKDWDKFREYERRVQPIMDEYNFRYLNQMIVRNITNPDIEKPDLAVTFYFNNPEDMNRMFQDPRMIEAMKWRDEHAVEKFTFIMGASMAKIK